MQPESGNPQGGNFSPQFAPALPSEFANPQFAVWALSNQEILNYIENTLRGRRPTFSSKTQELEWSEQCVDPILNDQGTFEVMRFLHGFTSKVTTLSKIPEDQMYRDLRDNALTIITHLFYNYRRYGLSPAKFDFLCTEIYNYIEFSLFKACSGATMTFLHPEKKTVAYQFNQEEPKKTGGSFLNLN